MRCLLDTHVLLWATGTPALLSPRCGEILQAEDSVLVWSAVGTVEVAVKYAKGKLKLPQAPGAYLERHRALMGLEFLPVEHRHAVLLADLPPVHGDPFDRLLVAQALVEGLPLLTSDVGLRAYGIEVLW